MIISRSVLLRMRKFSYESCRENQNTHIFVFVENSAFYEIIWGHIVGLDWLKMAI
jgi:hypothetical protein